MMAVYSFGRENGIRDERHRRRAKKPSAENPDREAIVRLLDKADPEALHLILIAARNLTRKGVKPKGVQSYQRDIYARFLCFGNGALTSLYDHSDGFFRRQLILTTKDKPTDRVDDPFLVEKMCAELEGILLWCLEGLQRLLRNNYTFTVSPKAAANVDTIKRSSNNVIDFMESEGYFRFKADYSISSKDFYEIYKLWCEDNACHSVSAIRFSTELRQNDRRYNLESTNNIYLPGGRRVRGFVGIEPLVHPCP